MEVCGEREDYDTSLELHNESVCHVCFYSCKMLDLFRNTDQGASGTGVMSLPPPPPPPHPCFPVYKDTTVLISAHSARS